MSTARAGGAALAKEGAGRRREWFEDKDKATGRREELQEAALTNAKAGMRSSLVGLAPRTEESVGGAGLQRRRRQT